jgi:hypothetical protein
VEIKYQIDKGYEKSCIKIKGVISREKRWNWTKETGTCQMVDVNDCKAATFDKKRTIDIN